MSGGPRWAALVSIAAVLLVVLGIAAPAAHGADGEAEVRIAAQRLANGRTEFALQQRRADGAWGERLLPSARLFPADATIGQWLASTSLTVSMLGDGATVSAENGSGAAPRPQAELRIAAQLLADGRIEFALQQHETDGAWGERLLPRARFFPAEPEPERWRFTTPLTVRAQEADAPAGTAAPALVPIECSAEATAARVTGSVVLVSASETQGTAFYIGNSQWLTAAHVVPGETSVRLANAAMDFTATVEGVRADVDLAVLTADTSAEPISWGETPRSGAEALVLGYGVGQRTLTAGITRGIVSERYAENGLTFIRTDASANPGHSGGPLLNLCGDLIGLIQSKLVGEAVEGVAYALDADSVRALLPYVLAGSAVPRTAPQASPPSSSAPSTLTITAFCNYVEGDSFDDCRAAEAAGLDADASVSIWVRGIEDWGHVRYSVDRGAAVAFADLTLSGLAPGAHTIHAIERRATGWGDWSAPYWFTIR